MSGPERVWEPRQRVPLLRGTPPRALMVAIDHGLFVGPVAGAAIVRDALGGALRARPDAIELSPGIMHREHKVVRSAGLSLVYRLDTTNVWREDPLRPSPGYWAPIGSVDDAAALGADVAVAFLLGGWADDSTERDNIKQLAIWARECRSAGLPLMLEPLPISGKVESRNESRIVRTLARMAVEIGCSCLKLDFDGDLDTFGELIADVNVPVLVHGRPGTDDAEAYLASMAAALRAGAAGLVVGRTVLAKPNVETAVRTNTRLIHGDMWEPVHA